jgi:hypothetical protein
MSDLIKTTQKVKQGTAWRKTITVDYEGDELELVIRQLNDREMSKVLPKIEHVIEDLQEKLGDDFNPDEAEEYKKLKSSDDLTDEEKSRLDELEDKQQMSESEFLSVLDEEASEGFTKAAEMGVTYDDEDVSEIMDMYAGDIQKQRQEFGRQLRTREDAKEYLSKKTEETMKEAQGFIALQAGIEVAFETLGDSGN